MARDRRAASRTATYEAVISREGAELFRVTATVTEGMSGGLRTWRGSFTLPRGEYLDPGAAYRIQLDDGRAGDILIAHIQPLRDPVPVQFQGSGGLG